MLACGTAGFDGSQGKPHLVGVHPRGAPVTLSNEGPATTWTPAGDGVMLFDDNSGRLRWVQPSGAQLSILTVPPTLLATALTMLYGDGNTIIRRPLCLGAAALHWLAPPSRGCNQVLRWAVRHILSTR